MKPPDRCYTPAIYHSIYRCCCHCLFHVFSLTVGHSRAYHVKLPNIGGSSHRSVKQSPAFFAVSPWNSIPLWSGFRGFLLTATASPIEVAKLTTHYLTLPHITSPRSMEKDGKGWSQRPLRKRNRRHPSHASRDRPWSCRGTGWRTPYGFCWQSHGTTVEKSRNLWEKKKHIEW